MLQVSEAAALLLKEAVKRSDAPDETGVRLEPRPDNPSALGIAFQDQPEASDQVVEEAGLRVFVAEDISDALDGRTLDVVTTEQGPALTLR